jgi:hypothetical protein
VAGGGRGVVVPLERRKTGHLSRLPRGRDKPTLGRLSYEESTDYTGTVQQLKFGGLFAKLFLIIGFFCINVLLAFGRGGGAILVSLMLVDKSFNLFINMYIHTYIYIYIYMYINIQTHIFISCSNN